MHFKLAHWAAVSVGREGMSGEVILLMLRWAENEPHYVNNDI